MNNTLEYAEGEEWVIWNAAHGLVTTVSIGRAEASELGRSAWLDEPFDMVGPFSLDELETNGRITFAACIVMSRERWRDEQIELRKESLKIRRAEQQRAQARFSGYTNNRNVYMANSKPFNERQHRETLNLPIEGLLEPRQIKTAFRRLAQKVHPDVGGSSEQFVRIKEAYNALLEGASLSNN